MRVRLNREVYSDLESILEYYLQEAGAKTAEEFYQEFLRCRSLLGHRATAFPIVRDNIRRLNLRRFPHHILFEIHGNEYVKVLVVKHDRRDPSFGLDR